VKRPSSNGLENSRSPGFAWNSKGRSESVSVRVDQREKGTMFVDKLFRISGMALIAVVILACGLFSANPATEAGTQQPTPATYTPTAAPASPTASLVIASPVPTQTFSPIPPVVGGSSVFEGNHIRFAPGGTWAEVGTHLKENEEIRYVLSASKGQVMSVSVRQGSPFVVEVASASSLLTDPAYEKPFWRGTLPASGDYTIIVKTHATGDFNLRVAVNPPGQAYQYFDYTDPRRLYTLSYSDEFAPTAYVPAGDFKGNPNLILRFIRPDFYGPTTNLGEAYLMVSTMNDPSAVATCTQPLSPLEEVAGHKIVNGYDFTQSESIGAAAGNIYDQVIYRTAYNNICYEIVFYMHSGNIGNYPPATVVEFDRVTLLQKFEGVLSTFNVQ
jgi:hypothetical protein